MTETTEPQNSSSKNGSSGPQNLTLYDQFQRLQTSLSQSQDKSSKGNSFIGKFRTGRSKVKKQEGSAAPATVPPPEAAADASNGDVSSEGSTSQRKRFDKKYEYPPGVRGFTKDEMSLEIMLLQDGKDATEIKKIGVVGLPGVGKTTLCKFIQENERVKNIYSQMEWISLPDIAETGNTEDIIDLNSDVDALSKELEELNQKLNDGKYLIVIDDVDEEGNEEYYKNLKNCINGLPKGKGGAVIVTCRSEENAIKVVGDDNLHRLQPLNNPSSCWWIYNEAVKGKILDENEVKVSKEVKEELMKRCGGLPGAARMLGKIKAQQLHEAEERNKADQNNNTGGS